MLFYSEPDAPLAADARPGEGIHHPRFGAALKAKLDPLGVECTVRHHDIPGPGSARRSDVSRPGGVLCETPRKTHIPVNALLDSVPKRECDLKRLPFGRDSQSSSP